MKCKCTCASPMYVVLEISDGDERKLAIGDSLTYGWSEQLRSPRGQESYLNVEHRGAAKVLRFE